MLISKHSTTRHTAVAKKILDDKKSEQKQQQQQQTCITSSKQRDVGSNEKCTTVVNNQQQQPPVNTNTSNQLSVPKKQYQPPRSNQQKPVTYIPIPKQYTAHQPQQQKHKPIQIISQQQQHPHNMPTSTQSSCYTHQQHHQSSNNRSPLSNIKNIQAEPSQQSYSSRGMKRSHSDTSMEKENHKRTRMETTARKQTANQQRSTTPDCSKIVEFKPITAPVNEQREFQFQQGVGGTPSWNNSCTIDNTNIAVLQKGADGKLTRISNIPLKALIGNLEVYKMKEPSTIPNVESSKQRSMTEDETKRVNIQNQAAITQQNNQSSFSYMKLLQEETCESELLNTFHNTKQTKQNVPSNLPISQMGPYIIES